MHAVIQKRMLEHVKYKVKILICLILQSHWPYYCFGLYPSKHFYLNLYK